MRIEIVIDDLTKLMACADTVTVLRQEYYDLHKNLSQVVPITEDINNVENCAKLIVEECKAKQCKSVVISCSNSGVKSDPGFSINFIVGLINQEVFKEVLLKPADYALEAIIIQVQTEKTKELIRKELAIKSTWSKARQLSFILDALKLKRPETCDLHYINTNDYPEYLEKFCVNCKEELLTRAENIFIAEYGEKSRDIFQIIKQFSEIQRLYLSLCETNKRGANEADKLLSKVMDSEYILGTWRIRREGSLMDIIKFYDPLFVYIKHLIPDHKWHKSRSNKPNIHNRRNKPRIHNRKKHGNNSKKKELLADEAKIEIQNDYDELMTIINKTRLLKKYRLPFPIDLLEEFWGYFDWKNIIDDTQSDSRFIIDLLSQY